MSYLYHAGSLSFHTLFPFTLPNAQIRSNAGASVYICRQPKPPAEGPVNDYGRAMADPDDPMGLGIFGCKFWGLKTKPISTSCEVGGGRGGEKRGGGVRVRRHLRAVDV